MQTFMPYSDFGQTARCLDMRRSGKQRVETLQILRALHDPDYGWQNHPAVKMWRGYEQALVEYGVAICLDWRSRGYKDTCLEKISAYRDTTQLLVPKPEWVYNEDLLLSHKSKLIEKLPEHYGPMWPDVQPGLDYVWPV